MAVKEQHICLASASDGMCDVGRISDQKPLSYKGELAWNYLFFFMDAATDDVS
jgi:hypothetical protein